jgi:energy-coupling factor transporter transmembrane protein EcfT
VVLATEAPAQRRTWVGLVAFIALEAGVFSRYTNVVVLACAVIAVLIAWRMRGTGLPLRALCWWAGSVVVFGAGVAVFNSLVYGGPLKSGYRPGEITFALSAIGANLHYMPAQVL